MTSERLAFEPQVRSPFDVGSIRQQWRATSQGAQLCGNPQSPALLSIIHSNKTPVNKPSGLAASRSHLSRSGSHRLSHPPPPTVGVEVRATRLPYQPECKLDHWFLRIAFRTKTCAPIEAITRRRPPRALISARSGCNCELRRATLEERVDPLAIIAEF